MTEKRFMVDDAGTLIDLETREMYDIVEEVCPLLNEQHETIKKEEENYLNVVWAWKKLDDEHKEYKEKVKDTLQRRINKIKDSQYHSPQMKKDIISAFKDVGAELGIDLE